MVRPIVTNMISVMTVGMMPVGAGDGGSAPPPGGGQKEGDVIPPPTLTTLSPFCPRHSTEKFELRRVRGIGRLSGSEPTTYKNQVSTFNVSGHLHYPLGVRKPLRRKGQFLIVVGRLILFFRENRRRKSEGARGRGYRPPGPVGGSSGSCRLFPATHCHNGESA